MKVVKNNVGPNTEEPLLHVFFQQGIDRGFEVFLKAAKVFLQYCVSSDTAILQTTALFL